MSYSCHNTPLLIGLTVPFYPSYPSIHISRFANPASSALCHLLQSLHVAEAIHYLQSFRIDYVSRQRGPSLAPNL